MASAVPHPRVLQMMLSTQDGGAETFFEKLAVAFANAGVPQCLIIEPSPDRQELFAARPGVEVHAVRFRGLREPFGRLRARLIVRRFQPDLILTWMNRATKRAPRGYCPVLARYGGYYKVDRCRDCERVIGNTPDIVRYLRENGISEQKAVCIPNFAEVPGGEQITPDTRREVRSELGLSESTIVLLAVGRLHRNKAHDTLLKALAAIPEAVLLVAGDGPLRAKLEQLAVDLGIAPRARFLGWRRDTARLYAAVDISVFPSRFEPYGNVVVECWAQRVPLIAADSTGPKWLVEDGKNGRLFPVDDVNALAAAIRELINNPGLRQTFVENGFHKYRDQFTREAIVQEYLRVFAEALGRVPSRGAGGP